MKVVILASDPGKKLWPLAQKNIPKAYLPLYSNMSYLLETIFRISGLIRQGNDIIIILPKDSVELLDPSILEIPRQNIICNRWSAAPSDS